MHARQLYSQEGIRINKESLDYQSLTGVLAWAAERNIPYQQALRSLVAHDVPLLFRIFVYLISPLYHTSLIRRQRDGYKRWQISGIKPFFRSAVESAITDLEEGLALSKTLQKHFRWWLPEFYIESISIAEQRGTVRETLIQLSQTASKIRRRRKEILSILLYPFIIIIFGVQIFWGLMVFVVPKFKRIFDDLLYGEPLPGITEFVIGVAHYFSEQSILFPIFLAQLPWMIYYFFCTHRGDWILIKIPFLGRAVTRWRMIETVQALAIYTKMNIPLDQCLDMICEQHPASFFKNALLKIKNDVQNGGDFFESWTKHFPAQKLTHFYIGSGLSSNNLSGALEDLAVILQDEDNRKHAYIIKILEPACLIILSFFIGILVLAMFMPMIFLINKMALGV